MGFISENRNVWKSIVLLLSLGNIFVVMNVVKVRDKFVIIQVSIYYIRLCDQNVAFWVMKLDSLSSSGLR